MLQNKHSIDNVDTVDSLFLIPICKYPEIISVYHQIREHLI